MGKSVLNSLEVLLEKWNVLLSVFAKREEDQLKIIYGLEQACTHSPAFKPLFQHILHKLYDLDTISEESVKDWWNKQSGKDDLTADQQSYLKKSKAFVEWLEEAESEESGSEES